MEALEQKILLLNSKVEIVKEDSLKYMAELTTKAKERMTFSMGEVYNAFEIETGSKLKYFWGTNSKLNRTFYSFSSEVRKVNREASRIQIEVNYPEKMEKLGVRKFYRLPIELEIYYSLINYLDHYDNITEVPMRYLLNMNNAITMDLSGNGAKILIESFCRKGQEIVVQIPEISNLKLLGIIEWLEPDKFNQSKRVAFSFKNMRQQDQDKIVGFIFSKMSKMRKRT